MYPFVLKVRMLLLCSVYMYIQYFTVQTSQKLNVCCVRLLHAGVKTHSTQEENVATRKGGENACMRMC